MAQSHLFHKFERANDLSNLTHQGTGNDASAVPDVIVFSTPVTFIMNGIEAVNKFEEMGIKTAEVSFEIEGKAYFKNDAIDNSYYNCRWHLRFDDQSYFSVQYDGEDDFGNAIVIDLKIDASEAALVEADYMPDFSESSPTP